MLFSSTVMLRASATLTSRFLLFLIDYSAMKLSSFIIVFESVFKSFISFPSKLTDSFRSLSCLLLRLTEFFNSPTSFLFIIVDRCI